MKKLLLLFSASVMALSCQTEPLEQHLSTDYLIPGEIGDGNNLNDDGDTELYSDDLLAGQTIDAGDVTVTLVDGTIVVNYETDGDWVITETHLFVGPLDDLPTNGGGNPRIGHFPYGDEYDPAQTSIDFITIDLAPGECVFVAAHAVVVNTVTGEEETAWGNGISIGGNNWSMMFEVCAP